LSGSGWRRSPGIISLIYQPPSIGRNVLNQLIEGCFCHNIGNRQANCQVTSNSCCIWYKAAACAFHCWISKIPPQRLRKVLTLGMLNTEEIAGFRALPVERTDKGCSENPPLIWWPINIDQPRFISYSR
jgi:hypothetical protein